MRSGCGVNTNPTDKDCHAVKVVIVPYDVGALTKFMDKCDSGLILQTTSVALGRHQGGVSLPRGKLDECKGLSGGQYLY